MANSNKQCSNLNPQEQEEFYRKHIKLKVESGLPRIEYCKLHGLSYREFGHYERTLSFAGDFLPIQLAHTEELMTKPQILNPILCSIVFKNGAELKVHDAVVLPTLISLLG